MTMEHKRIFILVKAYPEISKRYGEVVCTAGIQEDGTWIRLYPVPFRRLKEDKQYKKYTWIDVDVTEHEHLYDPRIESYRPVLESISPEERTTSKKADWESRKHLILNSQKIYTDMQELINEAYDTNKSLAIFKPQEIISMTVEKRTEKELEDWRAKTRQINIFYAEDELRELRIAQQIPYKFSYVFIDSRGKRRKLLVEDWELGMLYLNCMNKKQNEQAAIKDVKKKYFDTFTHKNDMYFFVGTTLEWHIRKSKNPFIIIGVFYPLSSDERQLSLF